MLWYRFSCDKPGCKETLTTCLGKTPKQAFETANVLGWVRNNLPDKSGRMFMFHFCKRCIARNKKIRADLLVAKASVSL